jgi:hypothetical protein
MTTQSATTQSTPDEASGKIVITNEELQDTKIDERLAQQRSVGPGTLQPIEEKGGFRLFYSTWFYLAIAGLCGALLGWAIMEPHLQDGVVFTGRVKEVDNEDLTPGVRRIVVSGVRVYVDTTKTSIRGGPDKRTRYSVDNLQVGSVVKLMGEPMPGPIEGVAAAAIVVEDSPKRSPPDEISLPALESGKATARFFIFPVVAGMIGLLIGAIEGLICRTFRRAIRCALFGLLAGVIGGCVSIIGGGLVYEGIGQLSKDPTASAGAFMLQMFRRGLAWLLAGTAMGLGQGLALKSRKLILNGFIGGIMGGLIGGLFFDPIDLVFSNRALIQGAELSRAIGFAIIGAGVGLMIGITDLLTRSAWLRVVAGPLRGKEFNFYQTPIRLGSSPKNEIYLFKDTKIEPVHAAIRSLRDTYEIEDADSSTGTILNGQRIKRKRLVDGDRIQIGDSEFVYTTRDRRKA